MTCVQRGPRGAQGAAGSAGAQGTAGVDSNNCQSIPLSDQETKTATGTTETVLYEYSVDFSTLTNAGIALPWAAFLDIIAHVSAGTGTVRLRVGGSTPGTVGGTIVDTIAVAGATDAAYRAAGTIAAVPATSLVQITGQASAGGITTTVRGISVLVTCVAS